MPVAHDGLTAKIIEQVGFKAFSVGGFGIAASTYGLPDVGILSREQMAIQTSNILNASSLPALVDADTGYGDVAKTIRELVKAGAAAIFIEDQVFPKRCGHTNVKEIVSSNEMCRKIKKSICSKKDKDVLIMARTDARSALGSIEAAIKRAKQYLSAGAEAIFIEAPRSADEVVKISRELKGELLLINMMEGGKTPLLTQKELEELGFKMIAYPITSILTAAKKIKESLEYLKNNGTTTDFFRNHLMEFDQFKRLIGFDKYQ